MELIIAKNIGFCAGVENTINKANELLDKYDTLYCLGEIVHNENVVNSLNKKGMITKEDINEIPDNSNAMFRAHGVPNYIYDIAKEKKLNIIDLTCPMVKAVHLKVQKNLDRFILIIGKKDHPEIIGTKSYAGEDSFVINNEEDILNAYELFKKSNKDKVYITSQTTYSVIKFNDLTEKIKDKFKCDIKIENMICASTTTRQEEAKEISEKANKVIIVGGKNSSNTKELYNLASKNCEDVYLVSTKEDLKDIKFKESDKVGIIAGASTPKEIVQNIIECIS